MASTLGLVILVITLAVIFDYINGFHDTANAIATVVSTNVLTPRKAVIMAAIFISEVSHCMCLLAPSALSTRTDR